MRRLLLTVAVLFPVVLAGAWLGRAELATAVMARAAQTALATDRIASLPEGLHVAFCGAGSPLPDPKRSGPCIAVIAGQTLVVVDAGSNGVRNLQRMGLAPGRISAVFITHFHSDHIDGLGELAMQRWVGGTHAEPLPVYGPPGVDQVVAGFNLAYAADFGYRTAHHGAEVAPPSGAGSRAVAFEMPAPGARQEVWNADGLVVTTFQVGHEPVDPAVGYRFDYGGRALVVSGDTRQLDVIADIARDVDVLLHEALAPHLVEILSQAADAAGQTHLAKITRDIPDYHASPVEAAETAARAGVQDLVLYHIVPPLLVPGAEAAFLRGVGRTFSGRVTVARDGTLVSLPINSREVIHRRLL